MTLNQRLDKQHNQLVSADDRHARPSGNGQCVGLVGDCLIVIGVNGFFPAHRDDDVVRVSPHNVRMDVGDVWNDEVVPCVGYERSR